MLKEFEAFISRGNVIDLAIGIIVGAAFTAIVKSVVGDLINPIISLFMGGIDFANLYIPLTTQNDATFEELKSSGIGIFAYGQFLMAVINFFVVAIVVFSLIKLINRFKKQAEAKEQELLKQPKGPTQEELLSEIRDLLKSSSSQTQNKLA